MTGTNVWDNHKTYFFLFLMDSQKCQLQAGFKHIHIYGACVWYSVFSTASQTLSETVPKITWFVNNFNHVVEGDRYAISDMGRTLTISNITEHDEKAYFCRGTNALGSFDGKIMLNVTCNWFYFPSNILNPAGLLQASEVKFFFVYPA